MVYLAPAFVGFAALLSVSAAPMPKPDSANGEIPVSAPNGVPMSDPAAAAATSLAASLAVSASSPPPMASAPPPPPPPMASSMDMASTMTADASLSTVSASSSYSPSSGSPPTYGSGSQSWGGSGYDSCVQQCAAQYGGAPQVMSPSPTETGSGGVSGSSGVTHTVIVAPSQGILRYVPFSLNASVGDTVSFKWWAGPHTVTHSSALEVCNKTSVDPFTSGQQMKGFTFNQVINDTNPVWIYCGVKDHCERGMFMGINIGQADPSMGSSSNYVPLSSAMSNLTQSSSDMMAMWKYTTNQTNANAYARQWGMGINVAGMSPEAMMQTAQNVMWTQTAIVANPSNVQNGKFVASDNMMVPMDLSVALSSSSPYGSGSMSSSGSGTGAPAAAAQSSAPVNTPKNGAGSIVSSSVAVGLVAVATTLFAL